MSGKDASCLGFLGFIDQAHLGIVHREAQENWILFQIQFTDKVSSSFLGGGYVFIKFEGLKCGVKEMRSFLQEYDRVVKEFAGNDFKEIEPIIASTEFSEEVVSYTYMYNELMMRKSITLITVENRL